MRLTALLALWFPRAVQRWATPSAVGRPLPALSPHPIGRHLQPIQEQACRQGGRAKLDAPHAPHPHSGRSRGRDDAGACGKLDLVARGGASPAGEQVHARNVADLATAWTEACALLGTSPRAVGQTLEEIAAASRRPGPTSARS